MSIQMPPDDLRARVLAATRSQPARTRAAGARRSALVVALGFTLPIVVSAWLGGPVARGHLSLPSWSWQGTGLPFGYTALLGVEWLLVSLVATWQGVGRGRSMLGRPVGVRGLVACLTPIALLATASLAALAWPQTLAIPAGLPDHLNCLLFTLLFALGPVVAFTFVRWQSDPVAPRWTGAAVGAASGAWGALGIELHCSHSSALHIVVGHVLPVLFVLAVGALLGDRVFGMRARDSG